MVALGVVVFGAAWAAWFFRAKVRVVVETPSARIESAQIAHPLQSPVDGYVTEVHGELGTLSERGTVIFQLDAKSEEHELAKARAEQQALGSQVSALRKEFNAVEGTLLAQERATELQYEEAVIRTRQADELAAFRNSEQERIGRLVSEGVVAFSDGLANEAETAKQRAEVSARLIAAERVPADQRVARALQLEKAAALRRETTLLDGRLAVLTAQILDIQHRIEQRRVRVPVTGRLGDLARLTAGSFVREGETLGTVIPGGALQVVAQFSPADALGRLRPGQSGRLRLTAFPWTQFGSVLVTVTHVAEEIRDAGVRVELSISDDAARRIPVQHGLSGSLEIQLETTTPALLLLRACGQVITNSTAQVE